MMERMGADTIICILKHLTAPADLASASIVCRSWRQYVLEGQLWRELCHREFPELQLVEVEFADCVARGSERARYLHVFQSTLEKYHHGYNQLYREFTKTSVSDMNCIGAAIAASSTDEFPREKIHETLYANPRKGRTQWLRAWSYWSSKGQRDPEVPETLTYKLVSSVCLIHEIKIRPFKAEFHTGDPIFSPRFVRFRLGYETPRSSCPDDIREIDIGYSLSQLVEFPWTPGPPPEYTWTSVSQEYPVLKEDVLQVFKLSRPVLCVGQILQVDLLGRTETCFSDEDGALLYYICICHVNVVGTPIRNFAFRSSSASGVIYQTGVDLTLPNT
ncbi:hypothetical protein R1flu_023262 [Riccia fluitans]|uniref:F-box domain-containing protein n=1 Tax=Riccia fluitans TaxID=41844 RepID=A0ABD1XRJ8_9MARC